MSLSVGIVGLPNVGKSTLFNALTKKQQAAAENYPFCTIEPNSAIVEVADPRLEALAKIVSPQQIIRATVEFTDIAARGLETSFSRTSASATRFCMSSGASRTTTSSTSRKAATSRRQSIPWATPR